MKTILALALMFVVSSVTAADSTFYFKTTDGVKLYVRVAGKGSPAVFVHGGPGSTSFYYEDVASAPLIEEKIKMVYFDQRGCGRSDSALNNDYSIHRMELDLEELRKALGFRQWSVIGHSFGGILITNYAHDFHASVKSLLLIECTLNMNKAMLSHLEFGLKELNITDQKPYRDTTKPLSERVWMVHDQLNQKGVWYKLMYRNAYEKAFNDSITFLIPKFNRDYANKVWGVPAYWKDFTGLTKTIRCPVLVMTGKKDYAIGPDHYKDFQFPNQKVVVYIGGHAPFQEEPQWYAEKVLAFLSGVNSY